MVVFAIFKDDPYGSAIRVGALTSILAGICALKINNNHGTEKFD